MSAVNKPSAPDDTSLSGLPEPRDPIASDFSDTRCILEPVCLDQFVFSKCPRPDVPCIRHRCERLADGEGQRSYGEAAWKTMKFVNPIAVIQMIEEIMARDSSFAH